VLVYITRRILYSIPVLIATTFITFWAVDKAGNPVEQLLINPKVDRHTVHLEIVKDHLNRSIPVQYWYWIKNVFTHKFGYYLIGQQPIWPDIQRTLGHTIQVVGLSLVIAFVLGMAIGIYSAVRQYSVFDYFFTTFSFLGFAMPTFWLALLLQIAFTDLYVDHNIRIFYTSGLNSTVTGGTWTLDRLQHIALPVMTLTIISLAVYSRYMRASMLDVLNTDYVRTARAKGLSEWRVIMGHVFRNALIPMATVLALDIGALFGGAIITESIFQIDGIGQFFLRELAVPDVYGVMAYLLITATMIILFNLVADIAYGFLDPRIRLD
jgi:ABC-type dipeptide/oligopeptide/nickel transport system permease component